MLRAVTFKGLDEARIAPWMTRVVVNLCVDYGREAAREPKRRAYWMGLALSPPGPDEILSERAAAAHACARIAQLPESQRQAVLLRAAGLPVPAIAEQLNVGYKAAESLLSRGRAAVRAALVAAVVGLISAGRTLRRSAPAPVALSAALAAAAVVWPSPEAPGARPPAGADAYVSWSAGPSMATADRAPAGSTTAAPLPKALASAVHEPPSLAEQPTQPRTVVAPVTASLGPVALDAGGGVTAREHEGEWQDRLIACVTDGPAATLEHVGCPPDESKDEPPAP